MTDLGALEWIGIGFVALIVLGSLIYKPVICCVCDGPMARVGPGKLVCLECGRTGFD